jgi:hypothetical protein
MADNFTPGETVSLNAQTTASSVSFSLAQSANWPDCLITNAGTVTVFVAFGTGASLPGAGVAGATPILPGAAMTLRKGTGTAICSAITSSGSALVYFTAGEGS